MSPTPQAPARWRGTGRSLRSRDRGADVLRRARASRRGGMVDVRVRPPPGPHADWPSCITAAVPACPSAVADPRRLAACSARSHRRAADRADGRRLQPHARRRVAGQDALGRRHRTRQRRPRHPRSRRRTRAVDVGTAVAASSAVPPVFGSGRRSPGFALSTVASTPPPTPTCSLTPSTARRRRSLRARGHRCAAGSPRADLPGRLLNHWTTWRELGRVREVGVPATVYEPGASELEGVSAVRRRCAEGLDHARQAQQDFDSLSKRERKELAARGEAPASGRAREWAARAATPTPTSTSCDDGASAGRRTSRPTATTSSATGS